MAATDAPADGVVRDEQPALPVRYKGLLTIAIMAATVLQILDTTIANVALPHMQAALGATQDNISWVLTSYIIAAAIATPVTGWLSHRIGLRPLFLASVAAFMIASMLCGIAVNLTEMVLFRLAQGVSGAVIGPLAQGLLFDINKKSDHPRAMGIFGMGIMIGPILGPIVGGWLTENFNWRWVFFVNLPVGMVCLALLWFLLPKKAKQKRDFDLIGFAFLAFGLAGLQLVLDRGGHVDWFSATEIWVELGISVAGFWMFGIHLFNNRNPIYPLEMLADRNLLAGAGFMLILGMVTMTSLALLPPLIQDLFNYPVIDAGLILAARGAGILMPMLFIGQLNKLIDLRVMVGIGFAVCGISLWLMTTWSLDMDWHPFILSGVIQGFGLGFIFVPLNLVSFATLPSKFRTEGAGLVNLLRSIGSSVGIAVLAALLARNSQVSHADLAQHITAFSLPIDPNTAQIIGSAGDGILGMVDGEVSRQAVMIAYLDDFKVMMISTFMAIPLLFLMRKPTGSPLPQEMTIME
jgi:DHA2 family multidrug resistance protein